MKKILLHIAFLMSFTATQGETTCKVNYEDKFILVGLEYNSNTFVPRPFIGVWADFFYDPTKNQSKERRSRSYSFISSSSNPDDYTMKVVIKADESSVTLTSHRKVSDWSLGYTDDEAQRKDIIKGKYLLDYDKPLKPLPYGVLPSGLVIRKYLIASNEVGTLFLVIYESDTLDKIKAHHRMPEYFKRSKDEDFWYSSI